MFTYCVIYSNIQCSKKLKDSKVIFFTLIGFDFYRFTGNIIDTQSIEIYSYETKGPKFKIFKDKAMVDRKLFDSMHRFFNIDKLFLKLYLYFLFIFFYNCISDAKCAKQIQLCKSAKNIFIDIYFDGEI